MVLNIAHFKNSNNFHVAKLDFFPNMKKWKVMYSHSYGSILFLLLNIKLKGLIGFHSPQVKGALNILVVKNESLKALRHLNVLRPKNSCTFNETVIWDGSLILLKTKQSYEINRVWEWPLFTGISKFERHCFSFAKIASKAFYSKSFLVSHIFGHGD